MNNSHQPDGTYGRGCRCEQCRADHNANHTRGNQDRASRVLTLSPDRHGTFSTYTNWGCRDECPRNPTTGLSCREAMREYHREHRIRQRIARWEAKQKAKREQRT